MPIRGHAALGEGAGVDMGILHEFVAACPNCSYGYFLEVYSRLSGNPTSKVKTLTDEVNVGFGNNFFSKGWQFKQK